MRESSERDNSIYINHRVVGLLTSCFTLSFVFGGLGYLGRKERRGLNSPCMIMQQTDVSRGLELSKKSHQLNLNESRSLLRREVEQKWTANNKVVGWDDESSAYS